MERTFAIIKPDAVAKGATGKIVDRMLAEGFKIVGMRLTHLSLRDDLADGPDALIAPLGTLWGDSPWHDAQRTGGTGLGDLVTPLIGSQFVPSAPDWAGKNIRYRIWITADVDPELLDLFSHPPLVRVPPLP